MPGIVRKLIACVVIFIVYVVFMLIGVFLLGNLQGIVGAIFSVIFVFLIAPFLWKAITKGKKQEEESNSTEESKE